MCGSSMHFTDSSIRVKFVGRHESPMLSALDDIEQGLAGGLLLPHECIVPYG